jgi:hypothetical protein
MRPALLAVAALSLATPLAAQRTLTATPELTIDGVEHDFSRIGRLAVSARGVIAVPQTQDSKVLVFDASGAAAGSFGRAGAGPGEFRSTGTLGWIGDTLSVYDPGLRRITLIGPDMKAARIVSAPQQLVPPTGAGGPAISAQAFPVSALGDDGMLASTIIRNGASLPAWMPFRGEAGTAILRMDAEGRFVRFIALRGSLDACSVRNETSMMMIPLCFRPLEDNSPSGRHVATLVPGDAGQYTVMAINGLRGDTVFSRQYSYRPLAVPKRVADSMRASRAALQQRLPQQMAGLNRNVAVAESYPGVTRLAVGDDGTIWLEEHTLAPAARRWRVLDQTGSVIGLLTVPRNVTLTVVSRDRVWATVTDDDDVQSVVRYGVR